MTVHAVGALDRTRVRLELAGKHLQQAALAGSIRPEDAEAASRGEGDVDPAEELPSAAVETDAGCVQEPAGPAAGRIEFDPGTPFQTVAGTDRVQLLLQLAGALSTR